MTRSTCGEVISTTYTQQLTSRGLTGLDGVTYTPERRVKKTWSWRYNQQIYTIKEYQGVPKGTVNLGFAVRSHSHFVAKWREHLLELPVSTKHELSNLTDRKIYKKIPFPNA